MLLITTYLLLPNGFCGTWTCYFVHLSILMPTWEGFFFIFLIALLRNILVRAESNQNQSGIQKRHKRIVYFMTFLSFSYFTTIQFIYGPDGIVFQVSQLFLRCSYRVHHIFWNTFSGLKTRRAFEKNMWHTLYCEAGV